MSGSASPFVGYPGRVWGACWQGLSWFSDFLDGGATPAADAVSAAEALLQTLLNGAAAVAAWQAAAALAVESANMAAIQVLPLTLDPADAAYLNARAAAVTTAAAQVAELPPAVDLLGTVALLESGQPAVADPGFLEWCMAFDAEMPPAEPAPPSLPADAAAAAWSTVAMAIAVLQGSATTQAYDAAVRMQACSAAVAYEVDSLSGPFAFSAAVPYAAAWNQCVALPTILLDASVLTSGPASLVSQQGACIRNALLSSAQAVALFLLALRRPQLSIVATATLRNADTLMDVAARAAGGFEAWRSIATLNGLRPPYPGPTNPAGGQTLLMPSTGESAATGQAPSYEANILGIDYDLGPVNSVVDGQLSQGVMPPWAGDFSLVTGARNYAGALGRRLQTAIGTYLYDSTYGSRIPPELGAVQDATEAQRLAAYARAALAADPRTGAVLNCTASVGPNFQAAINASVVPVGPNASPTPVALNETLSPLP